MITRVVDGKLQMRCLSLKQPYLHLIFDLPDGQKKDIENRSRSVTSDMGPLLMAASAGVKRVYYEEACEGALKRGVPEALLPKLDDLQCGVLYGCVRLVRQLPKLSLEDKLFKWKFPGSVGYVLQNQIRLPPRPISGKQTMYYVDLTDEEQGLLRAAGMLP